VKLVLPPILCLSALVLHGQAEPPVDLPPVTVNSPRVANQAPVGTFPMPVSALRYEPRVDIQGRNLAEGQADVTIRGGIFESTGFQVGAVTLLDSQTGHYLAEIPIAPTMLGSPEVATGADLATNATNSTSGAVSSRWRAIRPSGLAAFGAGQNGLVRGDFYQGYTTDRTIGGQQLGADVAVSHSRSDGALPFGDHHFDRVNGRIQLRGPAGETDLFAGYQAKFFGWPNLYTPFRSNESENLQTLLFAANHRADLGGGEFVEIGAYHRRNKDDYAFNRFAPLGPVHPFQHTTRTSGGAVAGRRQAGGVAWNFRAEILADELQSTSLTAGRYRSRTLAKFALVPDKTWSGSDGSRTTLRLGATWDDSNRDDGAASPVFEIARERNDSAVRRLYFSYAKTTQLPSYTALNSSATAGLFRGNPNLGRERTHNVEFGLAGTFRDWTGQAAVFWRRDDALVDWTFQRNVTARTANAVDVDTAGFEAFARRAWKSVDLVLGYTFLAKDADYRGATVDASFYALNYARHRLTAAFTWRLPHGFEMRMDNVARVQADNALRATGGDEALFSSLAVAYRPQAWRGLELSLQADNLWNSNYQEVPAVPAAPRQIVGAIVYAW
jgi:outer membrane receptor protein involved in Fe transport